MIGGASAVLRTVWAVISARIARERLLFGRTQDLAASSRAQHSRRGASNHRSPSILSCRGTCTRTACLPGRRRRQWSLVRLRNRAAGRDPSRRNSAEEEEAMSLLGRFRLRRWRGLLSQHHHQRMRQFLRQCLSSSKKSSSRSSVTSSSVSGVTQQKYRADNNKWWWMRTAEARASRVVSGAAWRCCAPLLLSLLYYVPPVGRRAAPRWCSSSSRG